MAEAAPPTDKPPEAPEKPPEKPREMPPEEPRPPMPKESTSTSQPQEAEYVECPDCDALIKPEKLGAHRWRAHKIDRRASRQPEPTEPPRTPPKKDKETLKQGDGTPGKRKSRWSEVGWK
jgi:hypothetical protein